MDTMIIDVSPYPKYKAQTLENSLCLRNIYYWASRSLQYNTFIKKTNNSIVIELGTIPQIGKLYILLFI